MPLKVGFDEKNYIPLGHIPGSIQIIIKGHGWNVFGSIYLKRQKPVVFLFQHPGLKSKLDTSQIRQHLQNYYDAVKVKKVIVDSTSVPFDIKDQKWLHMKLDKSTLSFDNKFQIEGAVKFSPDSVLISGPKSIVDTVRDTLLIKIPYTELKKDFDENFMLSYFLHDPSLYVSQEKVNVQFAVKKRKKSDGK